MIDGLKALMIREGRITADLINADPAIPSHLTYARRFGSQLHAYRLAGYAYRPTGCAPRG